MFYIHFFAYVYKIYNYRKLRIYNSDVPKEKKLCKISRDDWL